MDIDSFGRDLRAVAAGGTMLDPEVVAQLMARARTTAADQLTEKSVVRHVSHIYELLGLEATPDTHRRVQATVQHLWP